ncbi:hypothetical protein N658DRAFT_129584 [Parathielavia hyrcaniae]|uniref:Uncharacterized protein n=1 Tax=Parathielavia hyrcaniae TaxID=113614 RepID=A0AAN6QEH2_9PEZI|nr:hypothetical protein N658DRAFT_129584 [Parathielavia hyrcaniae]
MQPTPSWVLVERHTTGFSDGAQEPDANLNTWTAKQRRILLIHVLKCVNIDSSNGMTTIEFVRGGTRRISRKKRMNLADSWGGWTPSRGGASSRDYGRNHTRAHVWAVLSTGSEKDDAGVPRPGAFCHRLTMDPCRPGIAVDFEAMITNISRLGMRSCQKPRQPFSRYRRMPGLLEIPSALKVPDSPALMQARKSCPLQQQNMAPLKIEARLLRRHWRWMTCALRAQRAA